METATLGGGCFWCTEAIFKRLKGVISVVCGYAGGSMGSTGHAESIQIEFDPRVLSYGKLLEVFWATHDPTTLNRQGADVGTEYRSIIFYNSDTQKEIAERSKEEMQKFGRYQGNIVTQIVPFDKFYKAEEHHQNFYEKNKFSPYCQIVINPKIQKLLSEFKNDAREDTNN